MHCRWEPDIVHSKFDSRKVQLPESNAECLERHHPSPDLNGMNCSFPPQTIRKYMNAATHSTDLDLGYLFDRFLIEGHDMQEMLSYSKEGGGPYDTMEDAACGYLRDGSLKWREWIRVTHDQQVWQHSSTLLSPRSDTFLCIGRNVYDDDDDDDDDPHHGDGDDDHGDHTTIAVVMSMAVVVVVMVMWVILNGSYAH